MDNRPLKPTLLNQDGRYGKLLFIDYLARMQSVIACTKHNPEHVALNAPYEWKPVPHGSIAKKGVLLIHGLMDSPFMMRDIGQHFLKKGFTVRSLLLPGHGTVPADLLTVHYQAWIDAAEYGLKSFQPDTEELYICASSMGCLLALYHAYRMETITGLLLFAPAIQIKSPLAPLASYHRMVSWAWPRAQWLSLFPETDSVRYLSLAMNGISQVHKLSRLIDKLAKEKKLQQPIFMVATADDETVSARAAIEFFQQQQNPRNRCILYTNDSPHFHGCATECVNASVPEKNIVNLSHVSLTISPQNSHYGENGDFTRLRKSRIHEASAQFGAVNDAALLWQKTQPALLPTAKPFYRLQYNPHFERLLPRIDEFVAGNS